ncbi:heavy metal-binding domain-containing protein [Hymenobacter terrestris]|uniref:Heavy metal binding domain-containing protein n=1 Tax=Hymenobacter terrestris TaxID=2748310 RepID=A0ABX2Q159_9BACT|nr:heavy metal-binding domain-containing protein [Hymenobacter terrestris]NVO84002.1 hypothetical protein [Hymenobacter terrestris]
MTYFKQAALAFCLLPTLALTSCEQQAATTTETTTTEAPAGAGTEVTPVATAAYICPMKCEGSASDSPGQCPVCKMDLEPNPAAKPATTL